LKALTNKPLSKSIDFLAMETQCFWRKSELEVNF
jgi:hypothetical protein